MTLTTIAFDGKILAADSQFSIFKDSVEKIVRLSGNRLFGSCGTYSDNVAAREWLANGGLKPKLEEGFHAILIENGELWVLEDALCRLKSGRKQYAVGSGRDFAVAAMHLGKSAIEAVAIAIEFDPASGGPIHSLTVDDPPQ